MKVYLVLFLSLLFNIKFDTINKGQIDSLKPLAHFSLTGEKVRDTININRLNKIASDYFESNPDSTIYYSQISIDLSRKINYQTGLANGLLQAAHANYFKGKFEKAKQEFDEAIAIFKKLKRLSDTK